MYEKQFGAPVFQRTGIGAPEFASASWDTPLILSDVADVYKAFCFGDEGATQFRTPEERYQFLSEDERVCSFLACAKFIRGADPVTREPIFGEPVLTVIHAPAVALAGKSISGEEVWPGVDSSSPLLVGDVRMVRYICLLGQLRRRLASFPSERQCSAPVLPIWRVLS